jgi:hypothetical protein
MTNNTHQDEIPFQRGADFVLFRIIAPIVNLWLILCVIGIALCFLFILVGMTWMIVSG